MKIKNVKFITIFFFVILCWLFLYIDALRSMELVWRRSETFAHGYFIFPIVLWLFWRDKTWLLNASTSFSWYPIPVLFISILVWIFAYVAQINVLANLSAVISLIAIIWMLIGNSLAWRYKFPLAYMLLAVPIGESLIPVLQDITAWFSVLFLKLNGISVFRDGLYIQTSKGMFEVAVACSGIRYLIACIAVGTLFGYLTYTKLSKQILFLVFTIVFPIIANGIRAYGIIAIAHYSDMEYATGVDHIIYGWVFFGFVIAFLFYIGGKFADPMIEKNSDIFVKSERSLSGRHYSILAILVLFMLFAKWQINQITAIEIPTEPTPAIVESEHVQSIAHSNWGITYTSGLQRSHVEIGNMEVVVAVYANKQVRGELVSGNNYLFNQDSWTIISTKTLEFEQHPINYVLLRNIRGDERLVAYRFNVDDRIEVNSNLVKVWQSILLFKEPNSIASITAFSMQNVSESEFFKTIANTSFEPIQNTNTEVSKRSNHDN